MSMVLFVSLSRTVYVFKPFLCVYLQMCYIHMSHYVAFEMCIYIYIICSMFIQFMCMRIFICTILYV